MARPTTKEELLHLSQANYKKLFHFIDNASDPNKEFPEGTMNRNIRDVLAHLHHWHLLLLHWYEVGMKDEKPELPAKGSPWKDTQQQNKEIWLKYQNTSLEEIKLLLDESYNLIQKVIEKHSNEELFEKKKYEWTGSTSLGSYLVSATSSHYDWAIKLTKKAVK